MNIIRKITTAVFGVTMLVTSALAQQQSEVPEKTTDPVFLFNRVCYAQVPVVKNIVDMSQRFAWEIMGGEDLKQFTTLENPDVLEGWDVRLSERIYRLGVVQSPPSEQFNKNYPEFKEGTATACTLVLDGEDDADVILARMNTLVGKEPVSSDTPDGDLLTTTWAGGNEDFKVFVFFKSDKANRANLLNVTILSKERI
jgi:hypothetical protein